MSHLHFPDGILPVWLWVSAWAIVVVLLVLALWYVSHKKNGRTIPLIGVLSAMMVVGMSFEIIALAYHINLAIPTAILLGPAGMMVAGFISNVFLALFGHGGMTVVGLNTLMLVIEGVVGYLLFFHVIRIASLFWRALIATFVALAISGILAIGLTAWVAPQELSHHEDEGGKVIGLELFTSHEEEGVALHEEEREEEHEEPADVKRFVVVALSLGAIGWIVESMLAGFVVSYLGRVKPDLIIFRRR